MKVPAQREDDRAMYGTAVMSLDGKRKEEKTNKKKRKMWKKYSQCPISPMYLKRCLN